MGAWEKIDRTYTKVLNHMSPVTRGTLKLITMVTGSRKREIPLAIPGKPLDQCSIAMITSCGVHLPEQERFDMDNRSGDPTYREFLWQDIKKEYMISHSHIDEKSIVDDINVCLPGDILSEFSERKVIKNLHPTIFSFMGYIPKTRDLVKRYAPEVALKLKEAKVDIVLLTPC